jgi:uncharacterized protein (TIGR02118 family)
MGCNRTTARVHNREAILSELPERRVVWSDGILPEEQSMIRVTVFHQNTDGKRFDQEYYVTKHIPAIKDRLGAACKRIEVDRGLSGGQPGTKPPFLVLTHLFFDSLDTFRAAFGPQASWVAEDRKNYTDEPPLLQISEVVV